jgi:ribosomal protein S18 acetylase RimI-like enzyme
VITESRPAVSIRTAAASDRAFLQQIAERLADFDLPPSRTAAEVAEADRSALNKALDHPISGTELFVAELNGRRAGCLLMWTLQDYFSGGWHSHISVIAVTREAEGKGVGRALMRHAETWARERGHQTITLSVFEGNRRAQSLYERMGYRTEIRRYSKQL